MFWGLLFIFRFSSLSGEKAQRLVNPAPSDPDDAFGGRLVDVETAFIAIARCHCGPSGIFADIARALWQGAH
jgi:hypothetical protein